MADETLRVRIIPCPPPAQLYLHAGPSSTNQPDEFTNLVGVAVRMLIRELQ